MDTDPGRVHVVLSNQSSCQACLRREHLSNETFLTKNSANGAELGVSDSYLDLGPRPIDWFLAGESKSSKLYPIAIQESIAILERVSGRRMGYREGEILFGHLANLLSMRIARALAQFDSMSAGKLCDVRIELASNPPISSQDAANVIASSSFGALVELLLASQRGLRVNSSLVEVSKPSEALEGAVSYYTRIHNLLATILRPKARRAKVLIVSPYIGKLRELALKVAVRASPIFFEIRPGWAQPYRWALAERRQLISEGALAPPNDRALLETLLLECLPSALLEHFETTVQISRKLGFPSHPLKVFTSNAFDADDVFKAYVATVRANVSYLVGQHGNNYGVARFTKAAPEVRTADAFLSWGWQGENVLPFGQLTPSVRASSPPSRGVVLVLRDRLRNFSAQDADFTFPVYLDAIFNLARSLSERGIEVMIRSHPSEYDCVATQFVDARLSSKVSLQSPGKSLANALSLKLAPVFCYDSTGVLEAASAGGECFVFAPDGLEHVDCEFRSNYRFLEVGGLLAEDAATATCAITAWLSANDRKLYREALESFADGIVKRPTALVMNLVKLLASTRSPRSSKVRN